MHDEGSEMLLGRVTPVVSEYAPHLLYPIPRSAARQVLGVTEPLPFHGVDLWHAYEMSWLDMSGKPAVWVGRFRVPANSPNIVESKSFKLYLNSLNSTRFPSDTVARDTIIADVSAVAGAEVALELVAVGDTSLAGANLVGVCLDSLPVTVDTGQPTADQIQVQLGQTTQESLYSHLLRSLCPVTGQPDWATVWFHYRGAAIEHASLLQYIIAYREHQEFHEQCVERMFIDISQRCEPELLHIQAFYTRRGGLDINPFRSSERDAHALSRLNRQ